MYSHRGADRWPLARRTANRDRRAADAEVQELFVPESFGELDRRVEAVRVGRRRR